MVYDPTACAIASIYFLAACWAFTGLRLFVRIHLRKGPFLDDCLAVVSLLLFTAFTIIFVYCELKGYIPLATYPSPEYGRKGRKYLFICYIFYSIGTYFMKLSFTCTLLRLIQTRLQYAILLVIMITGTILTPVAIIFWSHSVATLVQAVWVMLADIVLGLVIPFILLRGIMMHFRTKLSIRILLGLSSIASITTIIRLVYLSIATNPTKSDAIVPMAFWSLIEQGMSILCVAASTMKPLFVRMGLVDPRDHDSPVRLNTADGEVFGGSTRAHSASDANTNTDIGTSSVSKWRAPIVRIFYDREMRIHARENAIMLSSGSSRGVGAA